jgi:hypothetical protein
MDDMSGSDRPTPSNELERIEDALAESLLDAAGEDVRKEVAASGSDPEALGAKVDAAIASARAEAVRARLDRARAELSAWRTKSGPSPLEREAARARFERLRSGNLDPDATMTMAARKGQVLSDSDVDGAVDDLAELDRLERDTDGG